MVHFKRILTAASFTILITLLLSCEEDKRPEKPSDGRFDRTELMGLWQYEKIVVANREFIWADQYNEPVFVKAQGGGERSVLSRRRIYYSENYNYQLRWVDRGDYDLGQEDHDTWQPAYGYYDLNEAADSLIHNLGSYYAQVYTLEISGKNMIRRSKRRMISDSSDWAAGDVLDFEEHFVKIGD